MRQRVDVNPSSQPKNDSFDKKPADRKIRMMKVPLRAQRLFLASVVSCVVISFHIIQPLMMDEITITHSKLIRKAGKTWTTVDWKNNAMIKPSDTDGIFKCKWTKFKSAATNREAEMCVHPFPDFVSDSIVQHGHWKDCNALSAYWNQNVDNGAESLYLEIGANIDSCVMEMLLGTNANIIAFEPHPMNQFALKQTISKLDSSFQDRLSLVPVGLGHEQGSSTIYSAHDNMGNSMIGTSVKDHGAQRFDKKLQFQVSIERLDSILKSGTNVKLMKMDAQGFECNIFEGMGQAIASGIETIKFEYAAAFLDAQKCTDLLDRMRNYGFDIYSVNGHSGKFGKPVQTPPRSGVIDLYAKKQKAK